MRHAAFRSTASLLIACGVCAAMLAATQPDKPPAGSPPAGQSAPQWPKAVEKKLYADDFRGKKAPEIVVEKMLTDKVDREGKVVLIDFWATWCGPCRKAIPELNEIQQKFSKDLVVIGISDESESKVRDFMKKTEMKYSQAIDTQGRMKKQIKVGGIPHVLIISTDGIVRWQGFPLDPTDPLTADVVRQIIEADPGVKARREKDKDKPGGG